MRNRVVRVVIDDGEVNYYVERYYPEVVKALRSADPTPGKKLYNKLMNEYREDGIKRIMREVIRKLMMAELSIDDYDWTDLLIIPQEGESAFWNRFKEKYNIPRDDVEFIQQYIDYLTREAMELGYVVISKEELERLKKDASERKSYISRLKNRIEQLEREVERLSELVKKYEEMLAKGYRGTIQRPGQPVAPKPTPPARPLTLGREILESEYPDYRTPHNAPPKAYAQNLHIYTIRLQQYISQQSIIYNLGDDTPISSIIDQKMYLLLLKHTIMSYGVSPVVADVVIEKYMDKATESYRSARLGDYNKVVRKTGALMMEEFLRELAEVKGVELAMDYVIRKPHHPRRGEISLDVAYTIMLQYHEDRLARSYNIVIRPVPIYPGFTQILLEDMNRLDDLYLYLDKRSHVLYFSTLPLIVYNYYPDRSEYEWNYYPAINMWMISRDLNE